MKSLVDHLGQYAEYHRDRRNIFSHFIGIPMIVVAVAVLLYLKKSPTVVGQVGIGKPVASSSDKRPAWVTSDTPLWGDCQTSESMEITCVGVSSLVADDKEAATQAREAALESAVRAIGMIIDNEDWSAHVGSPYLRIRQAKEVESRQTGQ